MENNLKNQVISALNQIRPNLQADGGEHGHRARWLRPRGGQPQGEDERRRQPHVGHAGWGAQLSL